MNQKREYLEHVRFGLLMMHTCENISNKNNNKYDMYFFSKIIIFELSNLLLFSDTKIKIIITSFLSNGFKFHK